MRLTEIRVDPRPIAVVRIALGIAVLSNALEASVVLNRVAGGRIRVPVVAWLPAPTSTAVDVCTALAVLAGVALAIGFFTRSAAVAAALLSAGVLLWDQQTYSNHRVLVMLLVTFLAFAQSDARWSVRQWSGRQATVPWWPQLLIMTQVSTCYFFAAASKVNPVFLDGDLFATWLRWPLPDRLYPLLALGAIATEFFLAVGLWWPKTRILAAMAGVALHASIVLGMAEQTVPLVAFALACIPTYALFLTRPSGVMRTASAASRGDLVRGVARH